MLKTTPACRWSGTKSRRPIRPVLEEHRLASVVPTRCSRLTIRPEGFSKREPVVLTTTSRHQRTATFWLANRTRFPMTLYRARLETTRDRTRAKAFGVKVKIYEGTYWTRMKLRVADRGGVSRFRR